MNHLPDNFPINRLVGRTLADVEFSTGSTSLRFDNNDAISSYIEDDEFLSSLSHDRDTAVIKLLSLVGHKISKAAVSDARNIVLLFDDGSKIKFLGNDEEYVTYSAYINGVDYFI